jgi:transketolase
MAIDAIAAANSGHLGMALGCAEIGAALFGALLNFNPANPEWINRDRFVLSAGHGSAFLYAWLHFAGYGISTDDVENFRKSGSVAHGHPEFNKKLGIECTTGPLGQGVANAVGMALSCKKQAAAFNVENYEIFTNRVVCLCGDGCLQEGISSEACSLAGHWQLDNLILIFDANGVTLDADLAKSQSEDVAKRFSAHGFEIFEANGNDIGDFAEAFTRAKESKSKRPRLLIAKTVIGLGVDEVAGTSKAHGATGTKFIAEAKRRLGLPQDRFFVSEETKKLFAERKMELGRKYASWVKIFSKWEEKNPKLAKILLKSDGAAEAGIGDFPAEIEAEKMSTRVAAGEILQKIAGRDGTLLSGCADLFAATYSYINGGRDFSAENLAGRNIYFGVREHAMAAISNGIAYEGVFRPVCATFLVFSDYMRAAMRVAALAKLGTIFILTHDSIAVGEDGPTHQPVETLASLRCMPNLDVIRPADYEEAVGAWQLALANVNRPTALILSRQDLPLLNDIPANCRREGVRMGAYVACAEVGPLKRIVLASGSEVHLAVQAAKERVGTRVVSVPCMEAFDRQPDAYKDAVLPQSCARRISIEAGVAMPWYRYVGTAGKIISVDDFGYSGQPVDLMNSFGIALENLEKSIEMVG